MNIYEALKYYYNYDTYRSNQADIVTSLVNGNNTIAILPTGGGKSVCFQIPALLKSGLCIVITPLISLMNDQVYEIKKMNINAAVINSTMSSEEINKLYENLNNYKFLYVSPERLENKLFLSKIENIKLSYIIIDEAHCIETWGSVFRTSYQRITSFTKKFNVPIGCFTATATSNTLNKIISILELKEYNLYQTSLSRNNLMFNIIKTKDKLNLLKKYLLLEGVKIIYCSTVKCVEYLYNILKSDFNITMYHGALDQISRNNNQNNFISGKIDLIVATNAFGMGINKSNVRYVIHYEISSSIEDYSQEAGRAGRDNNSSKCIVLFNDKDLNVHYYQASLLKDNKKVYYKKINEISHLKEFIDYKGCYEYKMKQYFKESSLKCGKCSNCLKKNPKVNISFIINDFDNLLNKYNISNNNYFLINEYYTKYKLYNINLEVRLIYNYEKHHKLTKLAKYIKKKENINILNKVIIYKLIYFNPINYSFIFKNKKYLLILNKYNQEIKDILN